MGVQLTPGQRCLLEILQRKLIGTLQVYAKLSLERKELLTQKINTNGSSYIDHDQELTKLREKIKRISARQKRFTTEIINGNGNNTIPKESFLKALNLVTRETLQQINSKSNERRRRTTANPRFSHEAIQAKKALQKPRVEHPRVTREKRNATTQATNQAAAASTANSSESTTRNNNNKSSGKVDGRQASTNSRSSRKATSAAPKDRGNRDPSSSSGANGASSSNRHRRPKCSPDSGQHNMNLDASQPTTIEQQLTEQARIELHEEFKQLNVQFELKANQVKRKLEDKKRLLLEATKRYLEEKSQGDGICLELCGRLVENMRFLEAPDMPVVLVPPIKTPSSASSSSIASSGSSQLGAQLELKANQVKRQLEDKSRSQEVTKRRLLEKLQKETGIRFEIGETILENMHFPCAAPDKPVDSVAPNTASSSSSLSSSGSSLSSRGSTCSSASSSPQPPVTTNQTAAKSRHNGKNLPARQQALVHLANKEHHDSREGMVGSPHSDNWMKCDESLDGLG